MNPCHFNQVFGAKKLFTLEKQMLFFIAVCFVFIQQCSAVGKPITIPLEEITDHIFKSNLPGLIEEMAKNYSTLVFFSNRCSLCHNATDLLDKKGLSYSYYEYDVQPGGIYVVSEVMKENNARLLPQIYICKQYIGGWTELEQLDKSGGLESKAKSC